MDVECASGDCVRIYRMLGSQEGHWSASLLLTKFCQKPNFIKTMKMKWFLGFSMARNEEIKKILQICVVGSSK